MAGCRRVVRPSSQVPGREMPQMKTAPLSTSESLLLDVIRTVAAMVVAFGHLTQSHFSTGWPDLTFLARDAVGVFFVLSGFVIRYVTCRKPATLGHYLGDRASRIYSIAIPALIFTLVADTISKHVNPHFYQPWLGDYGHPISRIAVNLLFLGQMWKWVINPLSNSPFWSVNYEVAYYLMYGCWFYLAGKKKWLMAGLICVLYGPLVVWLAPLWILGCVLHDLFQIWRDPVAGARTRPKIVAGGVAAVALAGAGFVVLRQLEATGHLRAVIQAISRPGVKPREYLFGIIWAVLFFAMLCLAGLYKVDGNRPFVRVVRFLSEGTFPIYLTHFPMYVLIAAVIPYDHANPYALAAIFAVVVVVGVLAGHPGNLLKNRMRRMRLPFLT